LADFEANNSLLISTALKAGKIGMSYFREADTKVWYKSGNSPVSEADKAIDDYLKKHLLENLPDHGWLSEETADDHQRLETSRVIIVDPIDGTRGFIAGNPQWCIAIAVVENGRPVESILHCPALDKTIYAQAGKGLTIRGQQSVERVETQRPKVTGSKKLIEVMRELPGTPFDVMDFIPSLAYRLSLVATGELDGAFARQGAQEWDVAAADLILHEAGCSLIDRQGQGLTYNRRNTSVSSLIASPLEKQSEILALANSHRILH